MYRCARYNTRMYNYYLSTLHCHSTWYIWKCIMYPCVLPDVPHSHGFPIHCSDDSCSVIALRILTRVDTIRSEKVYINERDADGNSIKYLSRYLIEFPSAWVIKTIDKNNKQQSSTVAALYRAPSYHNNQNNRVFNDVTHAFVLRGLVL